jgi:hypothetical protein
MISVYQRETSMSIFMIIIINIMSVFYQTLMKHHDPHFASKETSLLADI